MRSPLWIGTALASLLIIAVSSAWGSDEPPTNPTEAVATYRSARYHGVYSGETTGGPGGQLDVEVEVFKSGDQGRWHIVLTPQFADSVPRSYELVMEGLDAFEGCQVQSRPSGMVCVQSDDTARFLSAIVLPAELTDPPTGLIRTRAQVTPIESTCFAGWVEAPVRFFRRACYGRRGELTEWQLLAARAGGLEVTEEIEVSATLIEPLADLRDLAIPYAIVPMEN